MATVDALATVANVKSGDEDSHSLRQKDFFWDQLLKYTSSAIVAQVLLTLSISLLRTDSVECFHPSDTLSLLLSYSESSSDTPYQIARGQSSYINKFCERSAPVAEYLPLYIFIHGILLVIPHFLWTAFFQGDFDSFFSTAAKLSRVRSEDTGEYPKENFELIEELELQYKGSKSIYISYLLKLVVQFLICACSICTSAILFSDFSVSFLCPKLLAEKNKIPPFWPLNVTVPCVYVSLRSLHVIQGLDYALTILAMVLILAGLIAWLYKLNAVLGCENVAQLTFDSGLWRDFSDFPIYFRINFFCTRIASDFDFLLLLLSRANASYGKVFYDIQVTRKVEEKKSQDHQSIYLEKEQQTIRNEKEIKRTYKPSFPKRKAKGMNGSPEGRDLESRVKELEDLRNQIAQTPAGEDDAGESPSPTDALLWFKKKTGRNGQELNFSLEKRIFSYPENNVVDLSTCSRIELEAGRNVDLHVLGNPPVMKLPITDEALKKEWHAVLNHNRKVIEDLRKLSGLKKEICSWVEKVFVPPPSPPQQQGAPPDRGVVDIALDISFGNLGYYLELARPFDKVISLQFDHYRNPKTPVHFKKYWQTIYKYTIPAGIFSSKSEDINKMQRVFEFLNKFCENVKVGLIVLGPIEKESHSTGISILLEYLTEYVRLHTRLLVMRPLSIGKQKCSYLNYKPPEIFTKDDKEEEGFHSGSSSGSDSGSASESAPLTNNGGGKKEDDGIRKVKCGGISCMFEFQVYEYKV